ncbi:hypothetical protein ACN47E_001320 [Coniothyrium glycines]
MLSNEMDPAHHSAPGDKQHPHSSSRLLSYNRTHYAGRISSLKHQVETAVHGGSSEQVPFQATDQQSISPADKRVATWVVDPQHYNPSVTLMQRRSNDVEKQDPSGMAETQHNQQNHSFIAHGCDNSGVADGFGSLQNIGREEIHQRGGYPSDLMAGELGEQCANNMPTYRYFPYDLNTPNTGYGSTGNFDGPTMMDFGDMSFDGHPLQPALPFPEYEHLLPDPSLDGWSDLSTMDVDFSPLKISEIYRGRPSTILATCQPSMPQAGLSAAWRSESRCYGSVGRSTPSRIDGVDGSATNNSFGTGTTYSTSHIIPGNIPWGADSALTIRTRDTPGMGWYRPDDPASQDLGQAQHALMPFQWSIRESTPTTDDPATPRRRGRTKKGSSSQERRVSVAASQTSSGPAGTPSSTNASDTLLCEICPAEFTGKYRKGNMGRHLKVLHGARQYPCEDDNCEKSFARQDARLKHYRKRHTHLASGPAIPRSSATNRPQVDMEQDLRHVGNEF